MKKQLIILAAIFLIANSFLPLQSIAQVPEKMKYQAVARDNGGNVLSNQLISFRISILQASSTGTSIYSETHQFTTNDFGLANLNIGNGTIVSGDFSIIDWSSDIYFLQVEMDETGGSAYQLMGTSQLLSVPYALHAKTAESITNIDNSSWSTTGNAGTDPATNFIGTTDNQALIFKVNNLQAGEIDPDLSNSFYGIEAGSSITTGYSNIANGTGALYSNTDRSNLVAVGDSALFNNGIGVEVPLQGTGNTAIGSKAMFSNTTGLQNTATGSQAMFSNITGIYNTAFGFEALYSNTNGEKNTAVGWKAMYSNESGTFNTATGVFALRLNTTGYHNSASGYLSMSLNTTGSNNTATGSRSLYSNSVGSKNTAIGYYTLHSNQSGSNNTAIGTKSLYYNSAGHSNIAIGARALYLNYNRSNLVAIGDSALYYNGVDATAANHAVENTAIGSKSMFSNTTGHSNTSIGYLSMYSNLDGQSNTSLGHSALKFNTSGDHNTATGQASLYFNSSGHSNTGYGSISMFANTTGHNNTAIGYRAMNESTEGYENTAIGSNALLYNTTAGRNVAVGYEACHNNTTGFYNTAVGWGSGPATSNIKNSTAIGRGASTNAWNQIRIGNNIVTSIGGYAGWTNISDKRFKKEIQNDIVGLDFILALEPVSYQLDMDNLEESTGNQNISSSAHPETAEERDFNLQSKIEKGSIRQSGFLAQDVEQAALSVGYDFSGVDAPKNEDDFYGLRYAEFVVPLVKGMQEQQAIIEQLKNEIAQQAVERNIQSNNYEKLLKRIEQLERK